jgi:hypothetical protein
MLVPPQHAKLQQNKKKTQRASTDHLELLAAADKLHK